MTRLVNELLSECLHGTLGWQMADTQFSSLQEEPASYGDASPKAS
jgi:hypothetical protein